MAEALDFAVGIGSGIMVNDARAWKAILCQTTQTNTSEKP
jgi:hypothetical protein